MDTYHWACDRWGAENIIGFDVHLDETTPHIQIQTIPVAKTKARGRASVKYVHKDDKSKLLSHKEWKKLPEEIRGDFVRTEVERREKECVSYAHVWGEDKYAVGRTYYQMHTDYYNEVGHKYGLERGDNISMLPSEERRERVHKNKAVLEAERQAKTAIDNAKAEKQQLEQQKDKLVDETQIIKSQKAILEDKVSQLEDYAAALDITEEDLLVPTLNTNPLVNKAWNAIKEEIDKPIPTFGQKEWREERRKAIKGILTELQTTLMQAKEVQKEDILKLGKSLYKRAMQDVKSIIEQSKQLQKENGRLTEENNVLKKQIASIDENAIIRLRNQKEAEIKDLHARLDKAEAEAVRSGNMAYSEHQRADESEGQIREMLGIPEIKKVWDRIQQNKKAFWQQIEQWIGNAITAIRDYAFSRHNDFQPKEGNTVAWGIVAEAFKQGLDPTDDKQRKTATNHLLEKVSWSGMTKFRADLTATRTIQLCDAMTVTKDLVKNLFLAAGGRGDICLGGGGSDNELTNWDGTRKRNGWGR